MPSAGMRTTHFFHAHENKKSSSSFFIFMRKKIHRIAQWDLHVKYQYVIILIQPSVRIEGCMDF